MSAVANQFTIRAIDRTSPDYLYSDNLHPIATRNGLWSEESNTPLDFLVTFAPLRAHSTYCTRRIWRIFSLVAPSIILPADTDPLGSDYPFSVPVDRPLAQADLMRVQRDHYEGTAYDLTQGLASGPYGRQCVLFFVLHCAYYIIAFLYAYNIYHVFIQATLIGLMVLHSPQITLLVQTLYKGHMNGRSLSFVHHIPSSL